MASALPSERVVLDEIEPRLHKRGYRLVRAPSPDQLPGFLKGFRPDAIAVGAKPSLVIEILPTRDKSGAAKAQQIGTLLSGQDDWRLEVIYAPRRAAPLSKVPSGRIRATLRQARTLADDEPRAALMLAWATLEAIARALEPELAEHHLPPGMLIDLLISNGHVPQSEVTALAALGEMRNAIAHGQLDASPAPADVGYLMALGERLIPQRDAAPPLRLGMITPSSNAVLEPMTAALLAGAPHITDNFAFAKVPEATVEGMIREVVQDGAPAVVVLCTNLFDSAPVALWGAIRTAGGDPSPIRGWGRRFALR